MSKTTKKLITWAIVSNGILATWLLIALVIRYGFGIDSGAAISLSGIATGSSYAFTGLGNLTAEL
ncbi:hypothetical protein [Limosilactobacillus ingluviei]|uniref:hypothetical protein n=1 Tax=Limosilactobacillus ingluviei TaxID=148604 RepID=UPI0023F1BE13|nr:hypothetical protein [Limosilactobacillus ingluviei]